MREAGDRQFVRGDIDELATILEVEVMMIGRVRVEVGAARLDRDLAQETRGGELVQSVVDGGERDADAGFVGLSMKLVGGDVPCALLEEEARQRQALAGRAQARAAQALQQL